jgi:hypothetical protein
MISKVNTAEIKKVIKKASESLAHLYQCEGTEDCVCAMCAHVKSVVVDLVSATLPEFELVKRVMPQDEECKKEPTISEKLHKLALEYQHVADAYYSMVEQSMQKLELNLKFV